MKRKKQKFFGKAQGKPAYRRVRVPLIRQTGGAHQPAKGGKYRRSLEKEKIRQEVGAELE